MEGAIRFNFYFCGMLSVIRLGLGYEVIEIYILSLRFIGTYIVIILIR